MSLFLLIFFSLYGAMHLYAFLKARAGMQLGWFSSVLLAGFLMMMIAAPVLVRVSEKAGYETFARTSAYIGYSWMGFVFLFCSICLTLDLYRLVVRIAAVMSHSDLAAFRLSAMSAFIIPLIGAAAISVYGYFDALNIRVEHIVFNSPKLPASVERLRIVQISDVHLGLIVRDERLGLILDKVKEAKPDIFVSTGDLVDGQLAHLNGLAEMLRRVDAPMGKYAITGNHEYIVGIRQAVAFTEEAGFTMLRDRSVVVNDAINLVGVEDPTAHRYGNAAGSPEKQLLDSVDPARFTLLLKHRPLFEHETIGKFDLQLSGHVHKGQIFPFSLLTKYHYPKHAGLLRLDGSSVYVSRGSGTWGPPLRFLAPPEVTVIDLVRTRD